MVKPRCEARVTTQGFFHTTQCSRSAKLTYDGKHYCGMHDPELKNARNVASLKKWDENKEKLKKDRQRLAIFDELVDVLEQALCALMCTAENAKKSDDTALLGYVLTMDKITLVLEKAKQHG